MRALVEVVIVALATTYVDTVPEHPAGIPVYAGTAVHAVSVAYTGAAVYTGVVVHAGIVVYAGVVVHAAVTVYTSAVASTGAVVHMAVAVYTGIVVERGEAQDGGARRPARPRAAQNRERQGRLLQARAYSLPSRRGPKSLFLIVVVLFY